MTGLDSPFASTFLLAPCQLSAYAYLLRKGHLVSSTTVPWPDVIDMVRCTQCNYGVTQLGILTPCTLPLHYMHNVRDASTTFQDCRANKDIVHFRDQRCQSHILSTLHYCALCLALGSCCNHSHSLIFMLPA
ncbi:hypothetical protein F5Y12DRAFT_738260 [Xylaria sp. FL1777]|nr:hypothetical protein F5Y12DRAFT_738260 [Xylaria sp. FL1777]